jgi:hypothetical protein
VRLITARLLESSCYLPQATEEKKQMKQTHYPTGGNEERVRTLLLQVVYHLG